MLGNGDAASDMAACYRIGAQHNYDIYHSTHSYGGDAVMGDFNGDGMP
ncbi:MAG: hypothetical protein MRQ11_00440 [Candidatus Midichloria mitochondrii]|nr:hypothetical protein [Candidatus Midichloria mitochondrii]MDJ1312554.1 hypothetical protein [Candidatus Midichloria mitochondrii]MDJ1583165.1 hypothetical protein [Candidatus Midichloria mitochondrii]